MQFTVTALFYKGYHTGSEFKIAHDLGVATLVAILEIGRASQAPDPSYNAEYFDYDANSDSHTCPQGHTLTSNGSWYTAKNYRFKQYKTTVCKGCSVRHLCTTAKQNGKIIQRSEFTPYIEGNKERVAQAPETYKKRQALVEHPFGTIKRQWGFLERFWAVISLTNRVLNPLGRFWMQNKISPTQFILCTC
jgi:hypothetical protein